MTLLDSQTDNLEILLRPFQDCHSSFLKLQKSESEKESLFLLSKFSKVITSNKNDTKNILKILYFIVERISLFQTRGLNFRTSDIEKCLVTLLKCLFNSHTIEKSNFEIFIAILKIFHKFIEFHAKTSQNISEAIYALCEHIFALLWKLIDNMKLEPVRLVEARLRSLNFFIFPPHYSLSRYFTFHLHNLFKPHSFQDLSKEEEKKISSILVTQSLKWLQISQFNSDTVNSIIHSKNNFYSLIIVLITIAFGTKDKPISGKTILRCFAQELSSNVPKSPPLLSIGVVISILKIHTSENTEISPGMVEKINQMLVSVSDEDLCDFYAHFYQIVPILLKEIGIDVEKHSQVILCYKYIFRIIDIFSRLFYRQYDDYVKVFSDEVEFHISVPLNIMRNAFQHFSKLENCPEELIHGFINTFLSFYRIITGVDTKFIKFKIQPFEVYVIASLVRIHHIAVLASKRDNQRLALEFLVQSIEMTSSILEPIRFEGIPEVLYLFELLTTFLLNTPGEISEDLARRTKIIIRLFSIDFYLSDAERNGKLVRNWIKILFLENTNFKGTFFQISTQHYDLTSKEKKQIIDIENEIFMTISTPLDHKLVDIILNRYSSEEISFQESISKNPVAPLLKISYLYDCGEWNVALEQINEILNKIQEKFENHISLESIQTYTLAKFWYGLLTYQISNNNSSVDLAPNYPRIGLESESVHIPNIPQAFLVAMEYTYILLRHFNREISTFFVKELEFVLKTLIFIFNLFSIQFYLILAFICSSIYLSEFCTNNNNLAVQTLNEFSEFLIENGYKNTFTSLQQIFKLQNNNNEISDHESNENILREMKNTILKRFLNKSTSKFKFEFSSSLNLLIESENEYFSLKEFEFPSSHQILIYSHSNMINLCTTLRKFISNILTENSTLNTHFSDKRIPFSILPAFLQRIFQLSQILIHSGSTQDATCYIDLGYQISGKLNLFEWRLKFLILGIQLDIVREKVDRVKEYLNFISKMRGVLSQTECHSSEEVFDGFSHLLKLKKLKMNRAEFKDFCCVTRKFSSTSNQLILQNFNEILRFTPYDTIETNSQNFTKNDYKIFQENFQEIFSNLHKYFRKIHNYENGPGMLKITYFPPNDHFPYLKMSQIQSFTQQIGDSKNLKSAQSLYKIATKFINGMQSNFGSSVFMTQPDVCQVLSQFYLQAGKSLNTLSTEKCDFPKCCVFNPEFQIATNLEEIYTNCIKSTVPYGSVLALKFSLSSLGELFSDCDPVLSSLYFNTVFGLSLRHLFLKKHSSSKNEFFDLFCFDSETNNPDNSLKDNFLSSLTNLQPNWTVITISWPNKGDNLFITRLRNGCPPILLKIPITKLSPPNIDPKTRTKDLMSLEEILSTIFELLNEANKPENIKNKSKWWITRTKANTALSETLNQIESEWFSIWRGIFLGKITISQDFVTTSIQKLMQFLSPIVQIPHFQMELYSELFEVILESFPLLKPAQLELILTQMFPDLESNNFKIISNKISLLSEELYENIADLLDKFECTPLSVPRGHIFLILDPNLHRIPWENLPILSNQSISRVPSLHFLFLLAQKYNNDSNIDLANGFYVLNPQGDLLRCENDFQKLFRSLKWDGVSGQPPEALIDSVSTRDLYVYCGHGSGSEYINKEKLLNIKGKAFTMLMGCSTSRLSIEGPYEYPNMLLLLLLAGFPTIIGTLWLVTDSEINLFTKKLIQEIVKNDDLRFFQGFDRQNTLSLALQQARLSCKLRFVTGAAPIIYGLPLY